MGKIFKNYTRRSSSLKTNWKMKSFTESCSEPCETSKKELLAKMVISFSFFQKNSILDVWKRSEYSSFHGHFSYAPKLRESFVKSRSTDSLYDQNYYNEMKRNWLFKNIYQWTATVSCLDNFFFFFFWISILFQHFESVVI